MTDDVQIRIVRAAQADDATISDEYASCRQLARTAAEEQGTLAVTHHDLGYVVLVATRDESPEWYRLLRGIHDAWYPGEEEPQATVADLLSMQHLDALGDEGTPQKSRDESESEPADISDTMKPGAPADSFRYLTVRLGDPDLDVEVFDHRRGLRPQPDPPRPEARAPEGRVRSSDDDPGRGFVARSTPPGDAREE